MPAPLNLNFGAGVQMIDATQINALLQAFTTGAGHTHSDANGITAAPGGGQANATPLTSALNLIMHVATAGDSVALPPALGGQIVFVANGATNDAAAWVSPNVPAPGDMINGIRAVSFTVPAGKACVFFAARDGGWRTVLSA